MDLMKGDLRHYLADNRPAREMQLSWLTTIAETIGYIHSRRVIIADVRLDILLLDDNLSVKFCDFAESDLMPLDWDLNGSDELGLSILTDIGQFGAVIYEVATGQRCRFDLTQERKEPEHLYTCPRRGNLPPKCHVWQGHIIDRCWTQAFKSAAEVAAGLASEGLLMDTQMVLKEPLHGEL